jgi:YidC/Oxa1 family membrane protein insertase
MDRRLILAVALSAAILMIFQIWFAPEKPAPPPTPEPSASSEPAGGGNGETPPANPPEVPATKVPPPAASAAPELGEAKGPALEPRTEERSNEILTAVFSNRGGTITSLELIDYRGPDGGSVNLVPDEPELQLEVDGREETLDLSQVLFAMETRTGPSGEKVVDFRTELTNGLTVRKQYTVRPESYLVGLRVEVSGAGEAATYRLVWRNGIPPAEIAHKNRGGSPGTIVMLGTDVERFKPGDFKKSDTREAEGNVRWAGVRDKYFMAVMIPPASTSSRVVATGDHETHRTGVQVVMPILRGEAVDDFELYLGPMDYARLKGTGYGLEAAVDLGMKPIRPLSRLLLSVMVWMYGFIPNYGLVIIILSVATKFMFYPLTRTSMRSMKAMQRVQPEIEALRKKYKDDNRKLQEMTMELYRKHKINPLGGCLPLLVQMPVFFALYQVLANSITMRHAGFVGWINDLSVPDTLLTIGGLPIHVLPIIMFVTTVAQQLLTPTADQRQKMMGYMMPLVMLFIFYSFPAGLNLYWTVNNVLTVAQQWWIHREEPAPAATPSTA